MGMTVFAGCVLKDRGGEGAKTLEAIAEQHDQNIIKKQLEGKSVEDRENKLHVLQLDVTNEDDWQRALAFIKYSFKNNYLFWHYPSSSISIVLFHIRLSNLEKIRHQMICGAL